MQHYNERNPYLKRLNITSPHTYSIDSGKYFLVTSKGQQKQINKNGQFRPRFRKNISGIASCKERYQEAKKDPNALHYLPDLQFDPKINKIYPMTDKFAGYAQFPYKMGKFPSHLVEPGLHFYSIRKSQSERQKQNIKSQQKTSIIFSNMNQTFRNPTDTKKYFNMSFDNMTKTKILPKNRKKTCYSYKCKYLKHFTFDQKSKVEQQTTGFSTNNTFSNTLGKQFYQKQIQNQQNEFKLISNMQ